MSKENNKIFSEAYVCECGYSERKLIRYGLAMGLDIFTFHKCCRKCGAHKDKIKLKSGYWKTKTITTGWWIFKHTYEEDVEFVESGKY